MVFDIVFMIQHYILYTDRTDPALTPAPAPKTNTPLLNGALSSSESPSEPPEPRFGRGQRHRSKPWEVEPELSVEGRDLLGGSAEP